MFSNDMLLKRKKAMAKVHRAIELHGGTTLLSTGITGDDARIAKAVIDAGVLMLEPNHPAVALARGHKGVTNMHDAEQVRHEITTAQMAEVTKGVRSVANDDIFITVGFSGGFTEILPIELCENDFYLMSTAGADGLHTHKSSLADLEELTKVAHKYGLCVDAYIGHPSDLHTFGLSAETPEEVAKVARQMESIGVDMIGLMTGMSYDGVRSGEIHPVIRERVCALVESVSVPTLAEGGINLTNYKAFKETGVNILVIGTSIDDMLREAAKTAVSGFLK